MSNQTEIIISGVGGQGLILCGTLLGEAAVSGGKKATLSSEYGVETRGTFSKSDLIVSDNEIYFPDVTTPDIVVCLAQVAYERYTGKLPGNAILIYNNEEVSAKTPSGAQEIGISLNSISLQLGSPAVANIYIMGLIAGYTELASPDLAKSTLEQFFGKRGETILAMNIQGFLSGFRCGQELRKAPRV